MKIPSVLANIDSQQIVSIMNTALLVAFIAIIVAFVFAFIRGLFRGWRYGTYRLGYFLIHIILGLALLEVIANSIGQIDLASILGKTDGSLALGDDTISFTISTVEKTFYDFFKQAMQTYSPSTDPTSITNLAYSFTKSTLKWITILLEALLLETVVNFFCFLLWHIAFKRIIPAGIRKRTYKQGKLVSAFEDLLISALCMCMAIAPLTSVVNSIVHGFETSTAQGEEKEKIKANNETYRLISDVVDAYEDSVFAKTFFGMRDENNFSFDQGLINWLTKSSSGDNGLEVSFIKEIQYTAGLASIVVESGLLSENATTNYKVYLFLTSKYPSLLISTLAKSDIVTGLLPFAYGLLTNMDELEEYIGNNWNIDYSQVNWSATLDNIGGLYDDIRQSGIMGLLSYDATDDKIIFDASNASGLFSEESQAKFNSAFARISNDNDEWKVFNDLLISFAVNTVINSASSEEASSSLSLVDFFPAVDEKYYVYDEAKGRNVTTDEIPPDYLALNMADEIGYIYRSMARLDGISDDFIGGVMEGVLNNSFDTNALTATMVDNIDDVVSIFTGEDENGVIKVDEETGLSENKDCLLDSSLICNAMPKVFKMLGDTLGSSLNVEVNTDAVNEELFYDEDDNLLPLNERLVNEKGEVSHLLAVASSFAKTEAGKNLLKNLDTMPGITYNPDESKSLAYIDPDIFDALIESLGKIDDSIFLSEAIPNLFAGVLTSSDGALSSFGITSADFNFSPVDKDGNSILGEELGKMLAMYRDCQDLFNYIKDNSDSLSSGGDTSAFLKGLANFCSDGPLDEYGYKAKDSSLYRLLDAFSSSKILNNNPNHQDEPNYNYRLLINTVLGTALGEGYTYNGLINDVSDENVALCKILNCLASSNILDALNGGSSISLSAFLGFDFRELLGPLEDTTMLRTIFTTYLNNTICGALSSSEDAMKGVSFDNVISWEKEGETLNKLIEFSDQIGDLSNLDLFNSDPDAVTGILSCLSSSQLFKETNEDGTTSYHFGQFLYYTLTDSMGDNLSFFSDRDDSNKCEQLRLDMENLDAEDWDDESKVFGSIVSAFKSLGGMDAFSGDSIDFASINMNGISALLDALAESRSIGRVLSYHFYEKIGETLKDASFELGGGHGDYALSEKVGNLNIDEIWESYDALYEGLLKDDDNNFGEKRKQEFSYLTGILRAATSPKYGIIDESGGFGDDGFSLSSTSGEFLVKPVLGYMAKSIVFNTLNKNAVEKAEEEGNTVTYTAFECEMAQIVYDTGIYGTDKDGEYEVYNDIRENYVGSIRPSKDYDAATQDENQFNTFVENYDEEISAIANIIDGFKSLDIDITNFSLTNFFTDENGDMRADADIRKANLDAILYAVNSSHLFYNLLPDKISEAIGGDSISGLETENANVGYLRKFNSDKVKSEISNITRILYYVERTGLGKEGASFSLDNIDPENTTELLATMANSYVFNSLENEISEDSRLTVFQSFLSTFLGGSDNQDGSSEGGDSQDTDSQLKNYYYLDDSPKDKANIEAGYYTKERGARGKAEYYVKTIFKSLTADDFDREPVEILNGDTYSLKTFLTLLSGENNPIMTALSGGDFTALEQEEFAAFLSEINGNELLYDCVPNALYKTVNGKDLAVEGLKMSLANPFFVYKYDANSDTVTLTKPNYTNKYPNTEIEKLSSLISRIKGLSDTLGNLTTQGINEAGILDIKELLQGLYGSWVFNKAGVNTESSDYEEGKYLISEDNDKETKNDTTDMTVFEQTMYKLYNDSLLATNAYSENYDISFKSAEHKLYTYIKNGTVVDNNNGENIKGYSSNLDNFQWQNEIDALTVGGEGGGLLYVAFTQHMLDNGVSLDNDKFNFVGENMDPSKIKDLGELCGALNYLSIVRDTVPLQIQDFMNSGISFDAFTSLTKTFKFDEAKSEYSLNSDSFYGYITKLEIVADSVASYTYSFDSSHLGTKEIDEDIDSETGKSTIEWSEIRPYSVTINGTNIKKVTVTFDTSDYFVSEEKMGKEGGALDSLVDFAIGIMTANDGTYPNFEGGTELVTLLQKPGMIKSAIQYLDTGDGFYQTGYKVSTDDKTNEDSVIATSNNDITFHSRDITFANMLSFSYGESAIDLGKYMKRGASYAYENINNVFEDNNRLSNFYQNEDDFLRMNLPAMATSDIIVGNDTETSLNSLENIKFDNVNTGDIVVDCTYEIVGNNENVKFTIDKSAVKMYFLAQITKNTEEQVSVSFTDLLANTTKNRTDTTVAEDESKVSKTSAFGQLIVSGMLARLIEVQDEYARGGSYLGSPINNLKNKATANKDVVPTEKDIAEAVSKGGSITKDSDYKNSPVVSEHQGSAKGLHVDSFNYYTYADDLLDEDISSLMGKLLTIEDNIGVLTSLTLTSGPDVTARNAARTAIESLNVITDSNFKLLTDIFYLGSMYDALTWNLYFYSKITVTMTCSYSITGGWSYVSPSESSPEIQNDFQNVNGNGYKGGELTPFSFANVASCIPTTA